MKYGCEVKVKQYREVQNYEFNFLMYILSKTILQYRCCETMNMVILLLKVMFYYTQETVVIKWYIDKLIARIWYSIWILYFYNM